MVSRDSTVDFAYTILGRLAPLSPFVIRYTVVKLLLIVAAPTSLTSALASAPFHRPPSYSALLEILWGTGAQAPIQLPTLLDSPLSGPGQLLHLRRREVLMVVQCTSCFSSVRKVVLTCMYAASGSELQTR